MPDIKLILKSVARSRWTIIFIAAMVLLLLELAIMEVRKGMPNLPNIQRATSRNEVVPLSKMESFCGTNIWCGLLPPINEASAFFTTNFVPPPPPPKPKPAPETTNAAGTNAAQTKPAAPPPPPPPTTKKIALVYQGFLESASGMKRAFVKVGDELIIGTNGASVVAGFVIADFDLKSLALRKSAQTNILSFNIPKEMEVPLK